MKWNDEIRSLRRRRNLTQKEIAYYLHVDVTTVSRWERGTVEPSLGARRRLSALISAPVVESMVRGLISVPGVVAAAIDESMTTLAVSDELVKIQRESALGNVGRHALRFWPEPKQQSLIKAIDLGIWEMTETSYRFQEEVSVFGTDDVNLVDAHYVPLVLEGGTRVVVAYSNITGRITRTPP